MEKNVVVREEGRDGLLYAKDCNGISVAASTAAPHQYYMCEFCGAEMLLTSRNGEAYFALRKGFEHKNPVCRRITARGTREKTFNVSPEKFIDKLCHEVFPHENQKNPREENNKNTPKEPVVRNPGRYITSLSQMYTEGLYLLPPQTKRGEYTISEYLISFKALNSHLLNPSFKLGARIIYARFMFYCSKELMLIFTIFDDKHDMHFGVKFHDKNDYYNYLSLFMEKVEENGKTKFRIKPRMDALIASRKWNEFKNTCVSACKKKADDYCKRCGCKYYTIFTCARQIYLSPAETEEMT